MRNDNTQKKKNLVNDSRFDYQKQKSKLKLNPYNMQLQFS